MDLNSLTLSGYNLIGALVGAFLLGIAIAVAVTPKHRNAAYVPEDTGNNSPSPEPGPEGFVGVFLYNGSGEIHLSGHLYDEELELKLFGADEAEISRLASNGWVGIVCKGKTYRGWIEENTIDDDDCFTLSDDPLLEIARQEGEDIFDALKRQYQADLSAQATAVDKAFA